MTNDQLARRDQPTALRRAELPENPFDGYRPLDRYTGGRLEMPRATSFIATISAGWRDEKGYPVVSRDGKIHLVDPDERAPYLREQLEASDHKRLTIAFTSNDPSEIVQERLVAYTQSSLQIHGDERSLTELDGKGGRRVLQPGTAAYQAALAKCMVTRSVYFVLAGWDDANRPRMIFDPRDGLSHYRLRFGSRNSLNAILGQLAEVASLTNGEIAGLPFELSLTYRDMADPTGKRRNVPIWSLTFKPPAGLVLDARAFRRIATEALEEGRQLSLPAPASETIELAASEYRYLADEVEVTAPSQKRLEIMQRGSPVNLKAATARYFAIAKGSRFGTDEGHGAYVSAWTDGNHTSLAAWLDSATQQDVDTALDTLERCVTDGERLPDPWEGLDTGAPEEPAELEAVTAEAEPVRGQVIDRGTGLITEPETGPDEDLDLLSLYRDRLQAIETAADSQRLSLAGSDVARDENILTPEQLRLLREAYKKRAAELGAN